MAPDEVLAVVETYPVTDIGETSAIGGGNVIESGMFDVTERGLCWSTDQLPDLEDNYTINGSGTGTFISEMEGLSESTLYYARAYATNAAGTAYGDQVTFETLEQTGLPVVITTDITNITYSTAQAGGEVVSDGGLNVFARGVCWSTESNPDINNNVTNDGVGVGVFTSEIDGLQPNTTYYFCAYATNDLGTAYGETLSFTSETLDGYMIWFAAAGASFSLDSVSVENITSGASLVLEGSDTLVLLVSAKNGNWNLSEGKLQKKQASKTSDREQNTNNLIEMPYGLSNQLMFKFYSGSYTDYVPLIPNQNTKLTANFVVCEDNDGVNYSTVTINGAATGRKKRTTGNTQVWMAQNLNVGVQIDGSVDQSNNGILEKYCFDNDTANCYTYGGLYLWNEAMQYENNAGAQGMCPDGWHIPTDEEWCDYVEFIDPTTDCATDWEGYDAGRKLKASFGWNVGNGTNSSGFTALPGGLRSENGEFLGYLGCATWWWTSSAYGTNQAMSRQIYCTRDETEREPLNINNAFSIRCINDFSLPTLTTDSITNITEMSATGGGVVVSDGGASIIERGICWSTEPNPDIMDNLVIANLGTGTGSFVVILDSLDLYTFYYVRAYVTNSVGTAYGNEVTFVTNTTDPTIPTIITEEITEITQNSGISGGEILSDGGEPITDKGVCWSINQNPTVNDSCTNEGAGIETFISTIIGLDTLNTYFVRAYATNTIGTAYGNQLVLTTLPDPSPCDGIDTILYGGQVYHTVEIGFQCWFKENLNIGQMIDGTQDAMDNDTIEKYCYENDTINCDNYGGLYQWPEAMQYESIEGSQGICPEGWHIATENDWVKLALNNGGFQFAGSELKGDSDLWPIECQGTNSSGFSALPTGLTQLANLHPKNHSI